MNLGKQPSVIELQEGERMDIFADVLLDVIFEEEQDADANG